MNARRMLLLVILSVAAQRASAGVDNLEARLEALDPSAPMAYFLLGEELAYEADDAEGRATARRLFVLAYLLDESRGGRLGLARSVALALADLEASAAERRWLLALAEMHESRVGAALWDDAGDDDRSMVEREAAALGLGLYLAGRYRESEDALGDEAVRDVLGPYARLLPGGLGLIDAALEGTPTCRECHNRRVVRSRTDPDGAPDLCATCAGDPGPRLPDDAILQHLLVQSLLLDVSSESWAADALSGQDGPLRVVDPGRLGAVFGVRVDQPWYREGAWVSSPEGAAGDDGDG